MGFRKIYSIQCFHHEPVKVAKDRNTNKENAVPLQLPRCQDSKFRITGLSTVSYSRAKVAFVTTSDKKICKGIYSTAFMSLGFSKINKYSSYYKSNNCSEHISLACTKMKYP